MRAKLRVALDLALMLFALVWSAPAHDPASVARLVPMALVLCTWWLVGSVALRHYDSEYGRSMGDHAAMTSVLVLGGSSVVALLDLSGAAAVTPAAAQFLLVLAPPALASALLTHRSEPFHDPTRDDPALVVGTGALGAATADEIVRREGPASLAGFLSLPGDKPRAGLPAQVLGPVQELQRVLATMAVGEVYLAGHPARDAMALQAAVRVCETLGVPFALPAIPLHLDRAWPVDVRAVSDGYLHYLTLELKPAQRALKRLIDIGVSAVALWVLAPLLLGVAIAIRLTSKGPLFFRQERVGLHGRHFNMLKFRSMVVNAEALKPLLAKLNEQAGPVFKMQRDPRVTPVGRFLRKYSIDELPQLVNVLRGDMSLVGPRPPVPPEVAQYEPWQRRRLSVRPGITCIWQVSGRNQISFEDWMYLDMQYIDHWSLIEDLRLILRTVPVVLTGHGAS